jgi:uncharacterized Zn-finger protein
LASLPFRAGAGYCPAVFEKLESPGIRTMARHVVPHFANDIGVEKIFIGVKEFNCMGARPPFDHPHVYLDMGADVHALCPYCSTLYVHDARLGAEESEPKGCSVTLAEPSE